MGLRNNQRFLLIFTLSIIMQSCSYQLRRVETVDAKKIWIKVYKDVEVAEMKRGQSVFSNSYQEQSYSKYSGQIISDTIRRSTYIQYDSVRVYLFNETSTYKHIFTSGLVSGQMLYCAMDSSCRPIPDSFVKLNEESGDTIVESLWGWTGHTITIDYFEQLDYVNSKPTQRRFKFWVYPYKTRFNGGNHIFFLELTNDNADNSTDIETFIKDSRVTFIKKAWMMI